MVITSFTSDTNRTENMFLYLNSSQEADANSHTHDAILLTPPLIFLHVLWSWIVYTMFLDGE